MALKECSDIFSEFNFFIRNKGHKCQTTHLMSTYDLFYSKFESCLEIFNNSLRRRIAVCEIFFNLVFHPLYKILRMRDSYNSPLPDLIVKFTEILLKMEEDLMFDKRPNLNKLNCVLQMKLGDMYRYQMSEGATFHEAWSRYKLAIELDSLHSSPFFKMGYLFCDRKDCFTSLFYYTLAISCNMDHLQCKEYLQLIYAQFENSSRVSIPTRGRIGKPEIVVNRDYSVVLRNQSAKLPFDLTDDQSLIESFICCFCFVQSRLHQGISLESIKELTQLFYMILKLALSKISDLILVRMLVVWMKNAFSYIESCVGDEIVEGVLGFVNIVAQDSFKMGHNWVPHGRLVFLLTFYQSDLNNSCYVGTCKFGPFIMWASKRMMEHVIDLKSSMSLVNFGFSKVPLQIITAMVIDDVEISTEIIDLFTMLIEKEDMYECVDWEGLRESSNPLSKSLNFPLMDKMGDKLYGSDLTVVVMGGVVFDTNIYMNESSLEYIVRLTKGMGLMKLDILLPNVVLSELNHLMHGEKGRKAKAALNVIKTSDLFKKIWCSRPEEKSNNDLLIIRSAKEFQDKVFRELKEEMKVAEKDINMNITWKGCIFVTEDIFALRTARDSIGLFSCTFDQFKSVMFAP